MSQNHYPFLVLKIALVVIAIALLGGGVYWYQSRSSKSLPNLQTPVPTSNNSGVPSKGNSILAKNQTGAETIVIDSAALEKDGFVVIHTATKDGKPGEVVGHSELLKKGESKNIEILLDESSKKGESYIAMLHFDEGDGDYGDEDEASVLKDSQGNEAQIKIDITSNSATSTETTEEE